MAGGGVGVVGGGGGAQLDAQVGQKVEDGGQVAAGRRPAAAVEAAARAAAAHQRAVGHEVVVALGVAVQHPQHSLASRRKKNKRISGRITHGGTRLELALDEMALLMTPTRRQLHIQQNMRDRLIAIECQD